MWRIGTVPPKPNSFDMRVPLAKEWRGLREEELKKVSGFEDAGFVHNTGFCGGAWSRETVVKMGEESIKAFQEITKKDQ